MLADTELRGKKEEDTDFSSLRGTWFLRLTLKKRSGLGRLRLDERLKRGFSHNNMISNTTMDMARMAMMAIKTTMRLMFRCCLDSDGVSNK